MKVPKGGRPKKPWGEWEKHIGHACGRVGIHGKGCGEFWEVVCNTCGRIVARGYQPTPSRGDLEDRLFGSPRERDLLFKATALITASKRVIEMARLPDSEWEDLDQLAWTGRINLLEKALDDYEAKISSRVSPKT